MEVDIGSMKLSLTNDYIKTAYFLSMEVHKHSQPYFTNIKKHVVGSSSSLPEVFIIAFKGPSSEWYHDDDFGVAEIDPEVFPALLRIGEGRLAKVNLVFLRTFKDLLNNSGFKLEVENALKESKKILFAGHSSGGAIASLATLWMLDEHARKHEVRLPIGCVTFGSPLIGDDTLSHSVRRETWSGHFTHFVMEHDIVPRIMLSPKTSIQEHLQNILNFLHQKVNSAPHKSKFPKLFNKKTPEKTIDLDLLVKPDEAVEFFENVLINASTVATHDAFDLMVPTSSLNGKFSIDFVKVSPYRPFGDFVFCTQGETLDSVTPRQQLVVKNSNAVLQLLFYFLQLPNEHQDVAAFAINSLAENFGYDEELNKKGLQLENMVILTDLNKDLFTSNGNTSAAICTRNKALYKLTSSAKWCLMAIEESEKRKKENEDQIKKYMRKHQDKTKPEVKSIEDLLDMIRKYKNNPGEGYNDYYIAFKDQNTKGDFVANVNRLEEAKIWDVVIEMVMRKDLPDEFEVWDELVDLATAFRRLVEPLDIANYYRHKKGSGYMEVRPKRYKFTQRWYEHAHVTGFITVSESNFIAEVEELIKEVDDQKEKTIEEVKEGLESIRTQILKWKYDKKIANGDTFWGDSMLSLLHEKLHKIPRLVGPESETYQTFNSNTNQQT